MTESGFGLDDMDGCLVEDVGDNFDQYFRSLHSRKLTTLNTTYLLPVDQDEVKVSHSSSLLAS
jgi:hypothetical protein